MKPRQNSAPFTLVPRKIRVINTLPRKNRNSTTEHALIDSTEIHKSINNNMSREGEMGQISKCDAEKKVNWKC
ncbi:unnamed protein product [Brugia pahangi]|uniref:Uncharacterized protein n=1 Tax=Brugia pahangi TaxID=6280 RepID=A0A0N4TMJ4_BRUPA|nr:unnamed protein product [Brugia pahangi]